MPHFEEMPSFLSDDTGPMLSPSRPPFDLPSHVRNSHEKLNGNARTSSHTSIKGSLGEGTSPEPYTDGGVGGRSHVNGEMLHDVNLSSLPNGRSSAGSWDHRSSRNGSTLSVNGGINGMAENGRRSPVAQNGLPRLSNGGDRNSVASTNGIENSPIETTAATTTNGDSEPERKA